jgi:hypothetical protein
LAKIDLNKAKLMMTIQTTKRYYSKVAEKVKELLKNDVKYAVIDVTENDGQYVPCFYDKRFNKDFRKKFEDKYNVLLVQRAKIFLNRGNPGNKEVWRS